MTNLISLNHARFWVNIYVRNFLMYIFCTKCDNIDVSIQNMFGIFLMYQY